MGAPKVQKVRRAIFTVILALVTLGGLAHYSRVRSHERQLMRLAHEFPTQTDQTE